MNVLITANNSDFTLVLPISFIFWGYVIAYVIHIIEESALGETFVGMMKRLGLEAYEWKHFFGFNAILILLTIISVIIFEIFGGLSIIIPLIFVFLFVTNGLWHLIYTAITRRYSPGLVTSIIYWILFYFLARYCFIPGEISGVAIIVSAITGTLLTALMMSSMFFAKGRFKKTLHPKSL